MKTTLTTLTVATMAMLALGGCSKTGPTSPETIAAIQQALLEGQIAVGGETFRDLAIQRGGSLSATLRWTFSNDLDIVVTDASCGTRDFYGCTILGSATTRTPRGGSGLEQLAAAVRAGQTVRFWINNLDDAAPAPYSLELSVH
jgi:hypothetical protein